MHIHIHIHHHQDEVKLDKILANQHSINLKLNKMSEINDQLLAEAQKTADSLVKIRKDIATLVKNTNPKGGLTEEEAQALLTKFQAISGDAADIDAQTADEPDAPVEGEQPTA